MSEELKQEVELWVKAWKELGRQTNDMLEALYTLFERIDRIDRMETE